MWQTDPEPKKTKEMYEEGYKYLSWQASWNSNCPEHLQSQSRSREGFVNFSDNFVDKEKENHVRLMNT